MIKTVIFDFDGTLHNTSHLYGEALRYAYKWLAQEGYAKEKLYTDEETAIYLGMTPKEMWQSFMPDLDEKIRQKASNMIGERMDYLVRNGYAILFDGVEELLTKLKADNYNLVILSNCRNAYMEEHKKAFNLEKWFDGFYPAEAYDFDTKENIFLKIKEKYPGDYIMIGDRKSDILVGTKHNIRTIGCLYGYAFENELNDADYLADKPEEIYEIIKKQGLI